MMYGCTLVIRWIRPTYNIYATICDIALQKREEFEGKSDSINVTLLAAKTCLMLSLVVVVNTIIGYLRASALLGELPVFSAWERCSTDLFVSLLTCYAVIYCRESGGRLTRFMSARIFIVTIPLALVFELPAIKLQQMVSKYLFEKRNETTKVQKIK
ncbi:unnamed protein product [Medioppia subpectinata]|uniref:Uncharacterized protein n=1 Tax=Medioppia subpectinata TaxID=1979941 RepID=A0A7R9PWN1_9ACAR|nr:unnamed protein product [Medioppia subpectinata]CAG2103494.1 unnamed protein product [Medioppia subpectinata]